MYICLYIHILVHTHAYVYGAKKKFLAVLRNTIMAFGNCSISAVWETSIVTTLSSDILN